MKTLFLTIYKESFDVMYTGEKTKEYRKPSKWILSRLFNKDGSRKQIDIVRFNNGYGNVPFFTCVYKGFFFSDKKYTQIYSNGLKVNIEQGDVIIKLGRIIESNLEHKLF